MLRLGWVEVGIIITVALLVFGPKKIPELGSTFGKTLRGFRNELDKSNVDEEEDSSQD
jgi:sec-independent protein translocase protein TatA